MHIMKPQAKHCARKATWLAFGLIALAAISTSAQDVNLQDGGMVVAEVNPSTCINLLPG